MPKSANQKESKRNALLREASIPKNTRAIILSYIEDSETSTFLKQACDILNITLLTDFDQYNQLSIEGADAFVTDGNHQNLPIQTLMTNQIVPIVPHMYARELVEFNPMKFEGNAFLFEENTRYHILEKIIRYLENIRYPGDRRVLLENVEKTKIV